MTGKTYKIDKTKVRLDSLIVDRGLVKSRHRARALIMAGKVLVNDIPVDKPGLSISIQEKIFIKEDNNPFVSRGGLKLEKALQTIPVSVKGLTCLDIGASTGGFTDCLIQYGACKVYAVDVGYGQFDWTLRQDPRVVVIERTNIRYIPYEVINEKVDLIVADTSFISLKIVIPSAEKFMKDNTLILALIKPQFEAGKENIGKGGVVKDERVREKIIEDIKAFFKERGYLINLVVPSPILGPKGNREYVLSLNYKENFK
ncbi:MAG: RNA methyltransferase [Desulfobacterales bacterium RIFOXYA12_FULL_46_15]|nr:MAG: RNA methyltransferase [Desulfobacterales bacterium RIFOXYA12_FULL_46_15]